MYFLQAETTIVNTHKTLCLPDENWWCVLTRDPDGTRLVEHAHAMLNSPYQTLGRSRWRIVQGTWESGRVVNPVIIWEEIPHAAN